MPPEYQAAAGLSLDTWIGIAGFFLTILVQSFAAWRWLSSALEKRDTAIDQQNAAFTTQVQRIDKDVATLRTDVSVQLAKIPTRETMDTIMQARFGPLENEVRALTLELARNGMNTPSRQS